MQPVGTVAPSDSQTERFFDRRLCSTVGTVTYHVEIVTLDFTRILNSEITNITKTQTLPKELVNKLVSDKGRVLAQSQDSLENFQSIIRSKLM